MDSRRFPVRLTPLPGESLDSWVYAYLSLVRIRSYMLLQTSTGAPERAFRPSHVAVHGIPNAAELEARLGFTEGTLDDLVRPLREYERATTHVGPVAARSLVRLLPSSRFCSECLAATNGRWMRAWRWPWNATCDRHGTVLEAECPECGATQRRDRLNRYRILEEPWRCASPVLVEPTHAVTSCRFDLRTAPQRDAADVVVSFCADLVAHFEDASKSLAYGPVLERLEDLLAVVGAAVRVDGRPPAWEMRDKPTELASALEEAIPALREPVGPAFAQLVGVAANEKTANVLPPRWERASPRLVKSAVAVRLHAAPAVERLRWLPALGGERPRDDEAVARRLADGLPAALWPRYARCIMPPNMDSARTQFRSAMIVALLLPGTRLLNSEVCRIASFAHVDTKVLSRCLGRLARADTQGKSFESLAALAASLKATPPPIDYARRRRIAEAGPLLTAAERKAIDRDFRFDDGSSRRTRMAELWIWEEITGGTFREAEYDLRKEPAGFEWSYFAFLRHLTPSMREGLTHHAAEVVARNGADDEPVTWEPELPTGSSPPGLAAILPATTVNALRERLPTSEPLGSIGRDLGLTPEHLRWLIRSGQFLVERERVAHGPTFLAEADLRRMIQSERLTVRATAAALKVNRNTVSAHCEDLGIARNGQALRRKETPSVEWLSQKYVTEKRTVRDVAAAAGCSVTAIARALRAAEIERRPRGGGSHKTRLRLASDLPVLLARASRGQGGLERVRRFTVVARSRSLNNAATQMGVQMSVIWQQMRRLERDAGGPLLVRTNKNGRRQELTLRGIRLLTMAREHLDGVETVDHPPEPLRTALLVVRGRERLARTADVVEAQSFLGAAKILGISASSIGQSIHRFEAALGFALLTRETPGGPFRATPKCRTLLRQAAAWAQGST